MLKSGDIVKLPDGTSWRIKLNGTVVYLFDPKDVAIRRTVRRSVLVKVLDKQVPSSDAKQSEEKELPENDEKDEAKEPNVADLEASSPHFIYAVCDLDSHERYLKIGKSGNVAATLQTYRRRVPGDAIVLTAKCADEPEAKRLEALFKVEFAEFRVDKSEVYKVRLHEVARVLAKQQYRQLADGLFHKIDK